MREDESTLIDRARSGDQLALAELLLAHYDRLARRVARKLPTSLRPVVDEEDILQETCAEVFQRIGSYEPKGSAGFVRWLTMIADHRLADAVKAEKAAKRGGPKNGNDAGRRRDAESMDRLLGVVVVPGNTPSQSLARREAIAAVQVGLAALPDDERRPVEMCYIQGLPVDEVARALNKKPRTVRAICYRALRDLRMVLGRSSQYFSRK